MKTKNHENEGNLSSWVLMLITAVVPVIVFMKDVKLDVVTASVFRNDGTDYDFFSYNKMVALIALTAIACAAFIIDVLSKKIKIKKSLIYIFMGLYIVFAFASSVTSAYSFLSFHGAPGRYQNFYVLLCYMIILFIAFNAISSEKNLKPVLYGITFSAVIITLIGIGQFFDHDIFQSAFGKDLILPEKFKSYADQLSFKLGDRAVYGTLFHTNYMGSFLTMLIPVYVWISVTKDKIAIKVGSILLSGMMFFALYASHSRAGLLVGMAAVIIVFIIAAVRSGKLDYKYAAAFAVLAVVSVVTINAVSKGFVAEQVGTIYNVANKSGAESWGVIKDLSVKDDVLTVYDNRKTFNIKVYDKGLKLKDINGSDIQLQGPDKTGTIKVLDKQLYDYVFVYHNLGSQKTYQLVKGSVVMNFVLSEGKLKYLDLSGNSVELRKPEAIGFKGHEQFASGRGFIWSRSIPLLKNSIVKGYGPDTFTAIFPQYDVVGNIIVYGNPFTLVDKVHNLYLEIALDTGIVSLILMLAVFVLFFRDSVRALIGGREYLIKSAGLIAGITGYLAAGLFNDSVVSVAPVFWILLGGTMGLLYIRKSELE